MSKVLSSDSLWKQNGGYYTENVEQLKAQPLLPDTGRLRDRRIFSLFQRYGNIDADSSIMEVGCGRSMWLPFLAQKYGCKVFGIDIEHYAMELAYANLEGAGIIGKIFCRDAFDNEQNKDLLNKFDLIYSMGVMEHFDDASNRLAYLANYLKPRGRIITTVPNLQGINWMLQRFASLERLKMHVVYNKDKLCHIHKEAGLRTIKCGYAGFYDGYISATDNKTGKIREKIHNRICWISNMSAEVLIRASKTRITPESKWFSPHVFCIAEKQD